MGRECADGEIIPAQRADHARTAAWRYLKGNYLSDGASSSCCLRSWCVEGSARVFEDEEACFTLSASQLQRGLRSRHPQ